MTTGAGPSWAEVLSRLTAGADLTAGQAAWAMGEILSGEATPAQIAGFAVGLRTKGESVAELAGLVDTMYAHARVLDLPGRWLDVVGTGGDRSMSVNISTMAALVAAGAGAKVAKHGNRSASSQAGAADVLEALGVRLDLTPDQVARVAEEAGITFCFAPAFHPALRHAAVPRRELAIATVFNFLGPLANPARPAAQAIGCADARMAPLMAGVFAERRVAAWVFRGDDGLDELTTTTTSQLWAVADGEVRRVQVDPARLGLPRATAADLRGGDVTTNAEVVRALVDGARGPVRDAVVLNAGAALAVYGGGAGDPLEALAAGIERARESLENGDARAALDRWVAASRAAGPTDR
jgi:anthranilate phosphoribosyltransferase